MGIEGGPSGVVAVTGSVAPVVAGIVNEGPVRGSLEGFRPMNIKPLGEIVFDPNPLTAESAISEAEAIIAEARVVVNPVNPQLEPLSVLPVIPSERSERGNLDIRKIATSLVSLAPRNDNGVEDYQLAQPEVRSVARTLPSPSISTQPETVYFPVPQEQLVEQTVKEEEIKAEDRVDNPLEIREEEDVEELKIKYVEDEVVSARRKYEIREAINKAKVEAEEEGEEGIKGSELKKYFAPEDSSNRSPIAEPTVGDGGLEKIYQVMASRDYSSAEEAKQVAGATIDDIQAVKKSKEGGKKAKEENIALARKDPAVKRHPSEEVVARVVKKSKIETKPGQREVEVTSAVITEEFAEPTIKDLGLADVFPKAV